MDWRKGLLWALCIYAQADQSIATALANTAIPAHTHTLPNTTACELVRTLPPDVDRCVYVLENCPADSLIPYIQIFYCHARPAGLLAKVIMQVICVLLLVLIFRLLASTADDFFSPILTQLSQEMGLPPRFAGVTLLALGNGAPDLVSSIAFVKSGKYQVAMGGLLGAGMFVGSAIAGVVILTAEGVKARGALLRDVSSYLIAVLVVAIMLWAGRMTYALAGLLLALYVLFVVVVLAADIMHIWKQRFRSVGQHDGEHKPAEQRPLLSGEHPTGPPEADLPVAYQSEGSSPSIEMTEPQQSLQTELDITAWTHTGSRSSGNSSGGQRPLSYAEKMRMPRKAYRDMAWAEIANSTTFFNNQDMEAARSQALLEEDDLHTDSGYGYKPPPQPHPDEDLDADHVHLTRVLEAGEAGEPASAPQASNGHISPEQQDRVLDWQARGSANEHRHAQVSAEEASTSGREELSLWQEEVPERWRGPKRHVRLAAVVVVFGATAAWSCVSKGICAALDAAEYPLWILRRATIPLVDAESYSQRWFLVAIVGGPIAALWYLDLLTLWTLAISLAAGCAAAAAVHQLTSPEEPPVWGFGTGFPIGAAVIALTSFAISAMWIDTIAGELVALLDYFGTLSGIPHTVLGLTVLAWGNSVGDLSTNMAMARRGLSNMAMTACFACPVFNLLMSLGLGFIRYLKAEHMSSTEVQLLTVSLLSIFFIWANGLMLMGVGIMHKQWVPAWYGWVLLTIYAVFVVMSLVVAFA